MTRSLAGRAGDALLGAGATRAETALALGAAAGAAVALPWLAVRAGVAWSPLQVAVAAVLAFDLVGGVAVNASEAGRRHHHRPGRTARHHLAFVALHGVHLAVVAGFFRAGDVAWAAGGTLVLVAVAALLLALPAVVRRPAALLAVAAVVAGAPLAGETPGLAWLPAVLALKLWVAYLLGTLPGSTPIHRPPAAAAPEPALRADAVTPPATPPGTPRRG